MDLEIRSQQFRGLVPVDVGCIRLFGPTANSHFRRVLRRSLGATLTFQLAFAESAFSNRVAWRKRRASPVCVGPILALRTTAGFSARRSGSPLSAD